MEWLGLPWLMSECSDRGSNPARSSAWVGLEHPPGAGAPDFEKRLMHSSISAQEDWNWVAERRIPSNCESGRRIMDEVLGQLSHLGWRESDLFSVQLALEEGIVNAIKHGNRFDPDKSVYFHCRVSPHRVTIEIVDQGEGFDPQAVPDCTCDDRLEVASGRGLLLMRSFMCRVEYADRGTRLYMEKRRSA
jgi:serine/threonine-protein kinase RsbW